MSVQTVEAPAPAPAPPKKLGRIDGLDLMRVFASCMVVIGHIAAWFALGHTGWWLTDWAETDIGGTFHLNPNLAFIGVGSFLMISGVVVTHVTDREGPGTFLYRRITRLAPLLWVVTPIAWIMINLGLRVSGVRDPNLDVVELLRGMVLGNFFTIPQIGFVGVTWTLLVQVVFYLYVSATIPLLRKRPWIPPAIAAAVAFIAIMLSTLARTSVFGTGRVWTHEAGVWATYLPLLCIGQLISLVYAGKLNRYAALALGSVHYLLFVWADRIGGFTFQGDAMPRTVLLLILLLLLMMRVNGPLSRSRFIKEWSRRTYAIYLVHLMCLYPVMDVLVPRIGPELAVLIGLAVLAVVSDLLHRFVEMPADRWLRARRRTKAPTRAG